MRSHGWAESREGPSSQPILAAREGERERDRAGSSRPSGIWVLSLVPHSLGWPYLSRVSLTSLLRATGTSQGPPGEQPGLGDSWPHPGAVPTRTWTSCFCLSRLPTCLHWFKLLLPSIHLSPCSLPLGPSCPSLGSRGHRPPLASGIERTADCLARSGQWAGSCPPHPYGASSFCPSCQPASLRPPGPDVGGQPLPLIAWPSRPKPGRGHGPGTADPILSCNLTLKTLSLQALVHKRVPGIPLWGRGGGERSQVSSQLLGPQDRGGIFGGGGTRWGGRWGMPGEAGPG